MAIQPFRPDSGYFQGPWANPLEAGYGRNDGDPGRGHDPLLLRPLQHEQALFFLPQVAPLGRPVFHPAPVRIPGPPNSCHPSEEPWPDFSPMRVLGRRTGFRPPNDGGRKPALPGARVSRNDHPLSWTPSAVRQQTLSQDLGPSAVRSPSFSTGVPDETCLCHGHWLSLSMALREFSHPLLWPVCFAS